MRVDFLNHGQMLDQTMTPVELNSTSVGIVSACAGFSVGQLINQSKAPVKFNKSSGSGFRLFSKLSLRETLE